MKTRIISGLCMVPFLVILLLGGWFVTAAVFLIALVGMREFYNGFKAMGVTPSYGIGAASLVMLYLINVVVRVQGASDSTENALYFMWLFLSVLMCMLYLFKIDDRKLEDGMSTLTGIVYIGFFSYHAVLTEDHYSGVCAVSPVWLIVITAFLTDICAYFAGYFLGKHKLCPVISPKKTIEGSVGGILGSVVVTALFGYLFMDRELMAWYVVMGIAGGIISQLGDLTASIFKRKMGIKDYGTLIPGHGGIMDRFDSVMFTAPMIYYMLLFIYGV